MSWPIKQLGEIFEIARGGSPRPIDRYITNDPNGYNWIMIGDAPEGTKYITKIKKKISADGLSKTRQVKPGDFLLTNSMSFGRPYILKTEGCIHDGWLVLSPRANDVSSDYFYHLLGSDSLKRQFIRGAAGAVVKNLNTTMVKGVTVPLPPLAEQKRIAGILDAADALRAKRREALAQLDTLLQATFLDLFGDPVTNPKGWACKPMGELCDILTGFAFKSAEFLGSKEGVALCRGINVDVGSIRWSDRVDWSISYNSSLARFEIAEGDVLLAMDRPWISDGIKAAIATSADVPALLVQRVARIRTQHVGRRGLVYSLIRSESFERHCNTTETTVPHISPKDLRTFPVIDPPLHLLEHFAAAERSICEQKLRFRQHLAELDTLFASLQSRAFRGAL